MIELTTRMVKEKTEDDLSAIAEGAESYMLNKLGCYIEDTQHLSNKEIVNYFIRHALPKHIRAFQDHINSGKAADRDKSWFE